jgi:hypothetical protein
VEYNYEYFLTEELVKHLFSRKDVFDNVPDRDFRTARYPSRVL